MRGSIVKKGGRYYIKYYVGKRQVWKRAGPTRKGAEKLLATVVYEIHTGQYHEPKPIAFAAMAEKWLEERAQHRIRPSTMAMYRSLLNTHILPEFGGMELADIRFEDVQMFISRKAKEGMLSAQTIKHLTKPLNGIFKYAVQSGYLRENPAQYVETPRIPQQEMDFLTRDEIRPFLEHTPTRWYPLFLCSIMTGMRRGEVLAMRWANMDWNRGCYFVKEGLSKYGPQFQELKSLRSKRAIDLSPTLLEALKEHRARQNEEKLRLGPKYRDHDLVFCTKTGTPLDADNLVKRTFNGILKDAGIRQIRFHDLRHTYASLLISQGESPKYIQNQMGHASIKTTLDRYGHLMPEVHQEAAKRLDNQLFGGFERFK